VIPRLLRLRNFMSYGDVPVVLDFTGIHLACLSGSNGNGKSALLDAMTWALWGHSRAPRDDDLVRLGATEMEVEFQFAVGAGEYRVLRKRTLRRSTAGGARSGTAALELQVRGPSDAFIALTGGAMAETQARLDDVLKLSYETFVNSAFLMQGHADEFTVKPPSKRKAVLADILGLAIYERLSEEARRRSREAASRADSERERVADEEEALARRPDLHKELEILTIERAKALEALREADRALWTVQAELQRLEAGRQSLEELRKSIGRLDNEVAALTDRHDEAQRAAAAAAALLQDETAILARADERRQVQALLLEYGRRAGMAMERKGAVDAAWNEIEAEGARLRNEIQLEIREAVRHEKKGAHVDELRRQVAMQEAESARVPALEAAHAEAVAAIEAQRSEQSTLQQASAALEGEMKPLRERLKMLRTPSALCPVCQTPLSEGERERLSRDYTGEGLEKKATIEENTRTIAAMDQSLARLKVRLDKATADLEAARRVDHQLGEAQLRLKEAEEAVGAGAAARENAALSQRVLDGEEYALEARVRLARARTALKEVGFDPARYASLEQRLAALGDAEATYKALDGAREQRQAAAITIREATLDLERRRDERKKLQDEVEERRLALAVIPDLEAQQAEAERTRARRDHDHKKVDHDIGALTTRLQVLDEREQALQGTRTSLRQFEAESDAYSELGQAFGKRGIQAMLIDNALPQLENGANAILARMSDNGMQVQFATQAQSSTGAVLETLDIRIADANGTRPYEMFSGGEAFRVNFAVRIALSRLLAERSGAQLQMLIIDEGFGTQDSQGREQLVEAINSIADDFSCIIVITHIDELKDLFATRIDVLKGLEGSRLSMTEA